MKFLRRFLFFVLVVAGLMGFVFGAVRLLFPPEKVRDVLAAQLEKSIGLPVSIEKVGFRPFSGFVAEGISVGRWEEGLETALRIERITLRYRWRALLRRRLEIVRVEFQRPEVRYVPDKAGRQSVSVSAQEGTETEIPLAFLVCSVDLKSASLEILSSVSDSAQIRFRMDPVDLSLSDLKLGSGLFRLEKVAGQAKLRFRKTAVVFKEDRPNETAEGRATAKWAFDLSGQLTGVMQPEDSLSSFPVRIEGKLRLLPSAAMAGGEQLFTRMREMPLEIGLVFRGRWQEIAGRGALSLRVSRAAYLYLPFSFATNRSVLSLAVFADSAWVNPFALAPQWQAKDGAFRVRGQSRVRIDTLQIAAEVSDRKFSLHYRFACRWGPVDTLILPPWSGRGLHGTLRATGQMENGQFLGGKVYLWANVDSGVVAEKTAGISLPVREVHLAGDVQLGPNGVPKRIEVEAEGKQLLGAPFQMLASFSVEGAERIRDLSWKHVRGIGEIEIQPVGLERFGVRAATGELSAALVLSTELGSDVDFSLDGHLQKLAVEYDTAGGFQLLPDVDLSFIGTLDGYPGRGEFFLRQGELNIGPFFDGFVSGRLDAPRGEMRIGLDTLHLNLVELGDYLPLDLQEGLRRSLWKSESVVIGDVEIWLAGDSLFSQIRGDLHLLVPYFRSRYWGVQLDSLEISGVFGGSFEALQFDLEGGLATFEIPGITAVAASTDLEAEVLIQDMDRIDILRVVLKQPAWRAQLQVTGTVDRLSEGPYYALYGAFQFSSDKPVEILRTVPVQGALQGSFSALSLQDDPDRLQLDLWLAVDSISAVSGSGVQIYRLRGKAGIHQVYNLESGLLESPFPQRTASDWLLVADPGMAFVPAFRGGGFDTLAVDSVLAGEYRMQNVRFCLRYNSGLVEIPEVYGELYGGNFLFSGWLWLNTGLMADMEYGFRGQISGVNSAAFPYVRGEGYAPFGMSLWVEGKGLRLTAKTDIRGEIEISEISSRTADHFLQSISTGRPDKGIQALRFLLKRGYRPTRFSLTIRDGNLYPVMEMSQPWYWPVRIAGSRIALSRLPLRSLLYFFTPAAGF
jgi:hypothetical protein